MRMPEKKRRSLGWVTSHPENKWHITYFSHICIYIHKFVTAETSNTCELKYVACP